MGQKKLTALLLSLQAVIIVLFAVFVRYDESANSGAAIENQATNTAESNPETVMNKIYPMFQDVHVMIFVGFGFLMSFLRRYGYGSVSFTMLLAAFCLQWAILVEGFYDLHDGKIMMNIKTMVKADFAAAVVLISFGVVLGKLSSLQLVVMAVVEIAAFSVNNYISSEIYKVSDLGASMSIHIFGACFGLAVSRVVYTEDVEKALGKAGAVYHSDLFSMIGTLFVWALWPSFTSVMAHDGEQPRAVINTYLAMTSCAVTAIAMSALVSKTDKLSMVHMENCTLAGGVAIGTCVNMMVHPFGALLVGSGAAVISVVGFTFITPLAESKLKIHDTCGVTDLHFLPGLLSGVVGIVAAALATKEEYGLGLYEVFPARAPEWGSPELALLQANLSTISAGDGRTASQQAVWQAAGLITAIAFSICTGTITGFILCLPVLEQPRGSQIFDDTDYWQLPDEGFPQSEADTEMDNLIK